MFSEDVDDVVPLALITTNPEFSDNVETMLAVDAKTEDIKINWGKQDLKRIYPGFSMRMGIFSAVPMDREFLKTA